MRRARVDNARAGDARLPAAVGGERLRDLAKAHGASISINGPSAPTLMNGADPDRAARERSSRIPGQRVYLREVQRNALRFCVVAYPVEGWCAPVYPELDPAAATRQVAADLASFCRVAEDDPDDAWDRHVEMLSARAGWLNELALDRLVLRAPGTELEVGMARGGKWCAADETTVHGHRFRANMPTEEVFTSPDPRRTSGTFRCTRPLTLDGRRIDGIHGRFATGRLVEIAADNDDDRSYLASYTSRAISGAGPPRRGRAGRRDSRIGADRPTYGITLLDENAASHIAFGSGYSSTRHPDGDARERLADPRRRDDRRARDGGHRLHRRRPARADRARRPVAAPLTRRRRTMLVRWADLEGADRTHDAGWNAQDLDAIMATYTDDVVFQNHTAGEAPVVGAEACARTSRGSSRAGPTCASRHAACTSRDDVLRQRVDGARDHARRAPARVGRRRRVPDPRRAIARKDVYSTSHIARPASA